MAKLIIVSAFVARVVSLAVVTMIGMNSQPMDNLGGTVHNFPENFIQGIKVGDPPTTFVDSARAVTATAITNTGDTTLTGDVFVASASLTGKFQVGGSSASSSSTFVAEIQSGTATTSVLFGNTGTKGTCLKMKSTDGVWKYARIVGTTFTVNTTACY